MLSTGKTNYTPTLQTNTHTHTHARTHARTRACARTHTHIFIPSFPLRSPPHPHTWIAPAPIQCDLLWPFLSWQAGPRVDFSSAHLFLPDNMWFVDAALTFGTLPPPSPPPPPSQIKEVVKWLTQVSSLKFQDPSGGDSIALGIVSPF